MCDPSTAPAVCGKPYLISNSPTTFARSSSSGISILWQQECGDSKTKFFQNITYSWFWNTLQMPNSSIITVCWQSLKGYSYSLIDRDRLSKLSILFMEKWTNFIAKVFKSVSWHSEVFTQLTSLTCLLAMFSHQLSLLTPHYIFLFRFGFKQCSTTLLLSLLSFDAVLVCIAKFFQVRLILSLKTNLSRVFSSSYKLKT